ncbi:hypothetical protein BCF33_1172 [Hasllibacter halocynthiae]|uniref:Uncharacterized protein n=1 Tax=Hasllibacter halocynthiae TaxID=595589 RepID=A0A2T0X9C1_9RHOB|nr:hypothetical protein [Hasllibacter halocynthiae]PRY95551.1 hypothetical protein BCF33_1172 [Hasllibacter halocynthiae]
MSAPDTNVEKQEKKHKSALGGMGVAVLFAVVLLVGLVAFVIINGNDPEGSDAVVDGRTGEVIVTE